MKIKLNYKNLKPSIAKTSLSLLRKSRIDLLPTLLGPSRTKQLGGKTTTRRADQRLLSLNLTCIYNHNS